tara:strand:- start:292 stop:2598 length:2307 start_codon:yes stop_codon:yes gene_type:complete
MAIDKDFVIKNGLQVNDDLIYADPSTDKVGIGTTQADKKLVVIGDSEVSQSLTVGSDISTKNVNLTGILTSKDRLDVGVGGSAVSVNASNKRVGINSTSPEYTVDIRGPVSTGTNAAYIFGDVEVTGNVTAANFTGQVQGGGDITLNNLVVSEVTTANNAEIYTQFNVKFAGNGKYRFEPKNNPLSIGFTANADNPTIFLNRGLNYRFKLDSGGQPFYIKTQPTDDLNNIYVDGVTGNGVVTGICTFKVPYNAPNVLYYQSSTEGTSAGGKIILNNDGTSTSSDDVTVSNILTSNDQANFNNIHVSGIATINRIEGPNDFSVSAGILTVRQDQTALIGVSTGSDRIEVDTANINRKFNITFVESPEQESDYKKLYVDTVDRSFAYNPNNNTLFVDKIETTGTISGVTTGSDKTLVKTFNSNKKFDISFHEEMPENPDYKETFVDNEPGKFSYNPVGNKLFVDNIEAVSIAVTTLTGVSTGASKVSITSDTAFTNNDKARILLAADNDPDTSRFDNILITNTLKYNRGKGVLIANGFTGSGSTITDLNASNIASGTIGRTFLPDGDLTNKGAVKLNNNVDSTLTTEAATINAVNVAITTARNVIPTGSKMLFYNASAPTGWTKVTETGVDNSALRVVAGAQAVGGSVVISNNDFSESNLNETNFTTIFTSRSVPLEKHTHYVTSSSNAELIDLGAVKNPISNENNRNKVIGAEGTGGTDSENNFRDYTLEASAAGATANSGKTSEVGDQEDATMNFAVRYVNFLLCEKQ